MLTDQEIETFVRDGFIRKSGLLSAGKQQQVLDATWEILAEQNITPDPASWRHAWSRRGVVKLREDASDEDVIQDIVMGNAAVGGVAAELIGPNTRNLGVRGVYPTLPIPRKISRPYEPHIEGHPCQIVVMYYLNDVGPKSGGLLVWPGTHREVYLSHSKRYDFCAKQTFLDFFADNAAAPPYELTGAAGDVIFFHHRLLHSGSNNFSDAIRFGILNDFLPDDYESTREIAPTEDNIWSYWSERVQGIAAGLDSHEPLTHAPADNVRKLMIKAQHMARRLKGKDPNTYAQKVAKDPTKFFAG